MIDFSTNTNPFGSSRPFIKVLKDNVHIVGKYPDYKNQEVLLALEKFIGVSSKNLGLGIGSTQFFFDLPKMLPYDRAVIVVPTFWEYVTFNTLFKKKIKKIPLSMENDFSPNYDLIKRNIKAGDGVFLCNVNNPTSVLYERKKLLDIIKNNPGAQFIIDETYLLFRGDFYKQSLVKEALKIKNLHIVISMSKFFSIPGLRLGILVSNKKNVEKYNKQFHIPYSVNVFLAKAILSLINDKNFTIKTRLLCDNERDKLYNLFKNRFAKRLYCINPCANFIFARILTSQNSKDIKNALEKKGILIRGGHELSDVTNKWLRFSIQKNKDNKTLIRALGEILKC